MNMINGIEDYYGGEQVFSLRIHQTLNEGNIEVIKNITNKADFENRFEKKIVMDYLQQLHEHAYTMEAIIRDYEEKLKQAKGRE